MSSGQALIFQRNSHIRYNAIRIYTADGIRDEIAPAIVDMSLDSDCDDEIQPKGHIDDVVVDESGNR